MRYNVSASESATDEEIKGFLQFVKTGEAQTEFTRKIMEAVDYVKMMEEGSYHHYMMVRLHENDLLKRGRAEGIAIGERRGAHDARLETARALCVYARLPFRKTRKFRRTEIHSQTSHIAKHTA